jgi:hypothetical protein
VAAKRGVACIQWLVSAKIEASGEEESNLEKSAII